jgi:PKD repeat protein
MQRFIYEDLSFEERGGDEFIAPLWATRKIGYLLNEIRLRGESQELVDEIVELSIRYGIITPYTSFLVEEPIRALSREGREDIADETFRELSAAPAAPAVGGQAVEKAQAQAEMEAAEAPAGPAEAYAQQVQVVGDRAFVLKDGVWTDTTFDPTRMETVKLPFASEAFFDLLTEYPEAGRYFALGERVIVVIDGVAYETVGAGEAPQGALPPAKSEPTTSRPAVTSAMPDEAGEVYTTLSADVVEGAAPLAVNFTGRLVGGPDNSQDYYCVESTFEFGDGSAQSAIPSCVEWTPGVQISREYSASYVYDEPGTYEATFGLGGTQSEPLGIVVRGKDEAVSSAEPGGLQTDEGQDIEARAEGERPAGQICVAPLGLLVLPLLGAVWVARRR